MAVLRSKNHVDVGLALNPMTPELNRLINAKLRSAGIRKTLPRLYIMEVLENNATQAIDVETLCEELEARGNPVRLEYIYRALLEFVGAGILVREEAKGGNGRSVYKVPASAQQPGRVVVCSQCGFNMCVDDVGTPRR